MTKQSTTSVRKENLKEWLERTGNSAKQTAANAQLNADEIKPTKAGVKRALQSMGYVSENETPPTLRGVETAADFTPQDRSFARYLIYDTDFGGAWKDDDQINMHCV